MNKILSARPAFDDDHFTYRTPRWVEIIYRGLFLSIAGLLTYVALSMNGISIFLGMLLWLASGILILTALRRRPDAASVYFVSDHGGIYFPSSRAHSIFATTKDVPWLHVPWDNISDVRIQLLLDETASAKAVVFSIAASSAEEREFLARHSVRTIRGGPGSGVHKQFFVGFSNFFHRHYDVISNIERFQTTTPAARLRQFEMNLEHSLAGKG
ncbi:MAG: hypothetical protein NT123_06255 [Proteobacteria bacterium]|nr:hypothetical protein [Pseudomonadota bacterium]